MSDTTANILAIDTSTNLLKLALTFGGDRLIKTEQGVDKSHGQILIKKIADLFESSGLEKKQLNAIAVCTGPGSFTGLRIGLAAAKGMAVALNLPLIGINVFEIAAYKLSGEREPVHVVVPLRRDEFFVGVISGGRLTDDIDTISIHDFPRRVADAAVAGYGFDLVERFPGLKLRDFSERIHYDGADLTYLAHMRLAAGKTDNPSALEPMYLKKSQAEIRFDQKHTK